MFIQFLAMRKTVFLLEISYGKEEDEVLLFMFNQLYITYTKTSPRIGNVTIIGTNPLATQVLEELTELKNCFAPTKRCKKPLLENHSIPYMAMKARHDWVFRKQINFS